MTRPRALVIGGSVGGLLAANLLRTIGWDAIVLERASGDLGDRGAGIGTREELFAVLRRIGIALDASIGVDVASRIGLDRSGAILHELPVRAVTSSWARIYRPLRDALPPSCYRAGALLERVEQDHAGVTAVFADGTRASGDLLIAADGTHSTVRRQLLPDAVPRYAGYVAWRGVADAQTVPPPLQALLFHHMVFGFPVAGMALSIPMPAAGAGGRGCHFVWFRPADHERALPDLCTDAGGRRHGISIPPPLIRPEVIAELRASADAQLPPQLAALVTRSRQPVLQPVFDLDSPRLVLGRVALLGDAAYVARPHVATGVTKAALDANSLVDALAASDDLAAALARYEQKQRPFGRWLVARGRHIGAHLEARLTGELPDAATLRARVEILLREYGAAGVVDDQTITARGHE